MTRAERTDGLVARETSLENWGRTLITCHELCAPFLAERRKRLGAAYLKGLTDLYQHAKGHYPPGMA